MISCPGVEGSVAHSGAEVMTENDETERSAPAEVGGAPSLSEVLERAGSAGEALKLLAEACPGTPQAEILAALEAHAAELRRKAAKMTGEAAAVERLSAVLEELIRRLGEGGGQAASDRQGPNQAPAPEPGDSEP